VVRAKADDIVLSERVTGVPLAVIRTPYVERMGLKAGAFARWMLRGRKTKVRQMKRASMDESGSMDYWQAGKSVAGVHSIEPAGEVVNRCRAAIESE
jgi:nitronate monooxygenase